MAPPLNIADGHDAPAALVEVPGEWRQAPKTPVSQEGRPWRRGVRRETQVKSSQWPIGQVGSGADYKVCPVFRFVERTPVYFTSGTRRHSASPRGAQGRARECGSGAARLGLGHTVREAGAWGAGSSPVLGSQDRRSLARAAGTLSRRRQGFPKL